MQITFCLNLPRELIFLESSSGSVTQLLQFTAHIFLLIFLALIVKLQKRIEGERVNIKER